MVEKWVCQLKCVSFGKIFWGGKPLRSILEYFERVNSAKKMVITPSFLDRPISRSPLR